MKTIKPSDNRMRWPRIKVDNVEARPRDLVIRIADWSDDEDEPAFDVEVYIGGVYDFNESKSCTKWEHGTMIKAKIAAINFAQFQIGKLL